MNQFTVFSGDRQFYVADAGLESPAPEVWTEEHVALRHNTAPHITALCPAGDISARIMVSGPEEQVPEFPQSPDFEIRTLIDVPTGKIGVFGWPWELQIQYDVLPGAYTITFIGFDTGKVDAEEDFYLVQIEKADLPGPASQTSNEPA
jgi:hypothetical protein